MRYDSAVARGSALKSRIPRCWPTVCWGSLDFNRGESRYWLLVFALGKSFKPFKTFKPFKPSKLFRGVGLLFVFRDVGLLSVGAVSISTGDIPYGIHGVNSNTKF